MESAKEYKDSTYDTLLETTTQFKELAFDALYCEECSDFD